jgi:putative membrane-bound dehydrogenase-like protein
MTFARIKLSALSAFFTAIISFPFSTSAQNADQDNLDRDYASELPRIAPTEPKDALATFKIHPEFKLELVAAEPLTCDPIAIAFDEFNRAFVVEMTGYSEHRDDIPGDIRMLEDTNDDGVYDKATVYVDNLPWPVAVTCWDGGIFVGAPPDILYCKDTDGDGKADVRKVVFTGLGLSNVQGMFNTFLWGLDNRIHAAGSLSGGTITRPDVPNSPGVSVNGRNFKWDPISMSFEATTSSAQHGMAFDDWGRQFECSNSDHIQMLMYEDRYTARNPFLAAPNSRVSIAEDGPSADVFRISPVEPWRIVRTRLRVKGLVPGPVEGGGRAAGYFTSATGVTIYRGDAWPEKYNGNAIIGDVGGNLIHRKTVEAKGIGLTARRADPGVEFIASTDIWFRPVQFANAPDGNLYVCDMYREVIEHPLSLPEIIKKHLDLSSGNDRGRIYRISPKNWKWNKPTKLGDLPTADLVSKLESANAWTRETAARLIYQRQDKSIVPALEKLANSPKPSARLHALCALDGLGALKPNVAMKALGDKEAGVRENALRLSEKLVAESPELRAKLESMTGDPNIRVRYQLAFSLGEIKGDEKSAALAAIAKSDASDEWIRLAILSSITDTATPVMLALLTDETWRKTPESKATLEAIAQQTGAASNAKQLATVLTAIESVPESESALAQSLVREVMTGLKLGGKGSDVQAVLAASPRAEKLLHDMIASARVTAVNHEAKPEQRVNAIETLAFDSFDSAKAVLPPLFDQREPAEVQMAALSSLRRFSDTSVGDILIESWPTQSTALHTRTIEALFSRKPWLESLLNAVENGSFNPANLDSTRQDALRTNSDAAIRDRAAKLFAGQRLDARKEVIDAYQTVLTMAGDKERGKVLFSENCAQCHKFKGIGHDVAPDLATVVQAGPEKILVNVLDPNAEVNPQYINYTIDTVDFETHSGIMATETANSITLKRANGETSTILRSNIEKISSDNRTIMPEGFEKTLDQHALADIIAFLTASE